MLPSTPRTFLGSTPFTVRGRTCAHCERAVTAEISGVDGVQSVAVDGPTGTVTVTASQPVDRADIEAALVTAGYALIPCPPPVPTSPGGKPCPARPPSRAPPPRKPSPPCTA